MTPEWPIESKQQLLLDMALKQNQINNFQGQRDNTKPKGRTWHAMIAGDTLV